MLRGYEERRAAFKEEGVSILAGSVDSEEKTKEVAAELGFPVAHSMTQEQALLMGSWYEDTRQFIQPSEFVITRSGKVMYSMYSNSPVGRMDSAELLTFIKYLNAQRAKK